ncbi:MAG: T9SS type A sorting domain-containing protein [Candidatus Kapaibacterium sp.]
MKTKITIYLALFIILNSSFLILSSYSQWEPDVRLSNDPGFSQTSFDNARCIAASGSVVHVVWYENRNGNDEIYYKRSTNSGVNWGADTRLTNNSFTSYNPSISVSGSVLHVLWYDNRDGNNEIYYKRSLDGGSTWGSDTRLTSDSNAVSKYDPSVAVSGAVVHVVWHDNRSSNNEIYYKRSADGGASWSPDSALTHNTANSNNSHVEAYGSTVHVVWTDSRDGNEEIYYNRSDNAGISWGLDTRLTNNTLGSNNPSISVSGMFVNVVWQDNRDGNWEIYHKHSFDAGTNWGTDTRLTNNTSASYSPSVLVYAAPPALAVHVVWYDNRDGNDEIYYKQSIDGGNTWSTDTRLTNNNSNSSDPSVAVSGSIVHVVWCDYRDGNWEIYYKRDPTGNPTGIVNVKSEIPTSYSLKQNYPNPFNPNTVIRFSLPSVSQISLKVYDVMGREVQSLVNEKLQAGTYETTFDGSGLNSGVYFYKLMTDGFTETRRMLLVK